MEPRRRASWRGSEVRGLEPSGERDLKSCVAGSRSALKRSEDAVVNVSGSGRLKVTFEKATLNATEEALDLKRW